jgi:hypothetical protein
MKRPRLGFYMFLFIPAIVCFGLAIIATIALFQENSTQYLMAEGFYLLTGCGFSVFALECKRMEEDFHRQKLS